MINLRMQVIMSKEAKIQLPKQIYIAILRLLTSRSFLLYNNDSHMLWIFIVCFNKMGLTSFPGNAGARDSLKPLVWDF